MSGIDQDDEATWEQLRARLAEIRRLVVLTEGTTARHVLAILDRPREAS